MPKSRTRVKTRPPKIPRRDRPNLRLVRGMLHDVPLEQVIAWMAMEAEPAVLAEIATRTIGACESIADMHGVADDMTMLDIRNRVCTAVALDAMNAAELDDNSGAELSRTLTTIHGELSRRAKAGVRLCRLAGHG